MDMRTDYVRQLEELDRDVKEMSERVQELLERACASKSDESEKLMEADQINSESSNLSASERSIETLALRLLLLQQPLAADMRKVSGTLKAVTDLKRIGEESLDILRIRLEISERKYKVSKGARKEMGEMTDVVCKIVDTAVASYLEGDLEKSKAAIAMDDEVDAHLGGLRKKYVKNMLDEKVDVDTGVDLLMIAKYFEGIGDHAESLAYWAEYVVAGTRGGEPFTLEG
ncbi:MAG: phosphate signaling complex PhoU family protein [Coriobacteriales bacterium]|jgi:phosphate transport system protein